MSRIITVFRIKNILGNDISIMEHTVFKTSLKKRKIVKKPVCEKNIGQKHTIYQIKTFHTLQKPL